MSRSTLQDKHNPLEEGNKKNDEVENHVGLKAYIDVKSAKK